MTSNQVTNSTGSQFYPWMNSQQFTGKTEKADFSSFMDATKSEDGKLDNSVSGSKNVQNKTDLKQDKLSNQNDNRDDKVKPEEKVSDTSKVESKEPDNNEIKSVKDAVDKIAGEIEDAYEVTEEELVEALANLGLDLMALLIPDNIKDISVELSGADGNIALVTDGELYDKITELTKTVEDITTSLLEDLGISREEFETAIENAVKVPTSNALTNVSELNVGEEDSKTLDEKISVIDETVTEVRNFSLHNNAASNDTNGSTAESGETEQENAAVSQKDEVLTCETPMTFVENLVEKTREALNSTEVTASYTTEDVQMILDQITERIKVEISPENSEISLRLHPESLGNVSVKISANNEGVLTATFNAQNESVKAVIESQAIVLKETLEAKGVTVEAIEVMVGSHEFERNLSDNDRRNGQTDGRRQTIRRINLENVEEETELNDEDIIQKEIMAQNGNTIDYTA